MTIGSILQTKGGQVHSIDAGTTVRHAVKLLADRHVGAVPVMREGSIVGVFSERDLLQCVAKVGPPVLDEPVERVMTSPAITVTPDRSILGALALMTERRIRHLPVMTEEGLVGIVSIGDLVKARIERIEAEAKAMREYITSA
jgi:CBS domain-containing protein